MPPRLESWIEEQKRLVELGGQTAYSFLLEGPDGKTWATFPANAEGLATMCAEAQRGLEAQLAAGQVHSAKWVSMDAEGRQLACMPCVLRGQSSEAAGAAKDTLAFTRATSQHLLASEALVTMWKNLAERLGAELEEERQENTALREALVSLRDSNIDVEIERQKALNDERRFDVALEELKPLFTIATNIVGEKVTKWVAAQEEEKARGKRKRKPRAGNSNGAAHAGAGPSGTTAETRLALQQSAGDSAPAVRGSGGGGDAGARRRNGKTNGAAKNGAHRVAHKSDVRANGGAKTVRKASAPASGGRRVKTPKRTGTKARKSA